MKIITRFTLPLLSAFATPAWASAIGSMAYGPVSAVPAVNSISTALLAVLVLLVAYRVLRNKKASRLMSLVVGGVIAGAATLGGYQLIPSAEAILAPQLSDPKGGTVEVFGGADVDYENTSGVDLIIRSVTPPIGQCPLYPTGAANECSPGLVVVNGDACNINCSLPSDVRLKRDVRFLTATSRGINLYTFRYLWSDEVYVGAMAQDLLKSGSYADAVSIMPNGYYAVDYSQLGFSMKALKDW